MSYVLHILSSRRRRKEVDENQRWKQKERKAEKKEKERERETCDTGNSFTWRDGQSSNDVVAVLRCATERKREESEVK